MKWLPNEEWKGKGKNVREESMGKVVKKELTMKRIGITEKGRVLK